MPETLLLKQDQFISRNLTLTANREHALGGYTLGFTGGNIGFGIASPTARMHVVGADDLSSSYTFKATNASDNAGLNLRNDGFIEAGRNGNPRALTIGYGSGYHTGSYAYNTIIGVDSASGLTGSGVENTVVGSIAGLITSGTNNVFIGSEAGQANAGASRNTVIGSKAMQAGGFSDNTLIGYGTGSLGVWNTAIGRSALAAGGAGGENVVMGFASGLATTGTYNTFIGTESGYATTTGSSNIFLGRRAGYWETGSSKLIIDSRDRGSEAAQQANAPIYGVMSANGFNDQRVTINAFLKIKNQTVAQVAAYLTPENGDIVYVTDTDGTFTSVGFWGYENGAWVKL